MYWILVILILPYLLFLVKIYRGLLKIKPFYAVRKTSTFVSVIVACRNERKNIPVLINDIEGQDYPKELFEVIVVDDNSNDNTFEIASGFARSENISVIYNRGTGKKQAIRTGINASKGSLIITTDADCRMGRRWLRTITSFYEKHRPDIILCPVQIKRRPGFFGRFQELEFLSLQGVTAGSALSGDATMCNGANLAFTKEAYLSHSGNLHEEISSGDDIFLLHSIKKDSGSKILWLEAADAMVTTSPIATVSLFLRQRSRWISKSKVYDDNSTLFLGIVTFIAIAASVSMLIAGIFDPDFFGVFLTLLFLKSVPDFLILKNTSGRYGRDALMRWFIPSQIVYPFYVLGVAIFSLFFKEKGISVPHL